MTYTRDEVLAAAIEYFDGDTLAADVWVTKYALRDADEHYYELTPTDMHRRIAREFARIEQKYPNPMSEDEIFNLLDKFKYLIPQGSPMSGIGNDYQMQSLSNCFVIPPPADSYGSILLADQRQAQIMKRRGGVGFDVSSIRPRGYPTSNAARTSDGLGVFMERFSNTCREVAQGGRRGALMLTVDVAHQDVETFIDIKRDLKKVTGANISLRISDEFMNAVENDEDFELRWPVTGKPKTTRSVSAKKIWDKIIDSAWSSAEPGVLFWDTMINMAPADIYADKGFKTVSTNPCVTGDTIVETSAGKKTVKELSDANVTFQVKTYDETSKTVKMSNAIAFKTRDSAKIFCLKLKDGRSIKLTGDHLVRTDSGWKRVDELQKTDKILSLTHAEDK